MNAFRQTSSSIFRIYTKSIGIRQDACKSFILRSFSSHTSARQGNVHALTGYAFAGKPRHVEQSEFEREEKDEQSESINSSQNLSRQGFPVESVIGQWTDAMLQGGESGEDALAITKMKEEGDWFLGIADGVGGWSENGIDPALFSQSLMYYASQYAKRFHACPDRIEAEEMQDSPPSSPLDTPPPSPSSDTSPSVAASKAEPGTPLDILQHAYQSTQKEKDVPAGSATACFLTFDSSKGILRSANLGDSGFLILRPGSSTAVDAKRGQEKSTSNEEGDRFGLHLVHHQSKPQTHGFNTPLQLSKLPPEYRFDGSIDSQPSHADTFSCRLMDGDIVLAATDGFWDNVSVPETLQLIAFIRKKHHDAWLDRMSDISIDSLAEERDLANVLAQNLLQYTLMCQFSTTKRSPFERDAAKHGIHYPGGKVDDVAILTALVVER